MSTYRITISDRKNARTVEADSASQAVCAAVGQRLYSANVSSYEQARDGRVVSTLFQLNIRDGRTVHGATPVTRAWATVVKVA